MALLAWSLIGAVPATSLAQGGKPAPEKVGYSGPAPMDRSAASLYKAYCLNCHGVAMAGDGPLARSLVVPVRDLRSGMRVTSAVEPHAFDAADVATVVERGVSGTPMASFAGLFTKPELTNLSRHVLTLVKMDPATPAVDLGPTLELTPDNVMEGASIYARSGCITCHGVDGKGGPEAFVPTRNDDGKPARFPRLHKPITWRGGTTARDIAARVARGVPGTPMPAYRPSLRDKELMQLGLYVETLAEVTTLPQLAEQWLQKPEDTDPVARGQHLLKTLNCVYCHRGAARTPGTDRFSVDVGPLGLFQAGDLLPASAGTDRAELKDALLAAVTSGRGYDGRKLMPLAMPWPHLGMITEGDADALTAALLALPRSTQEQPRPQHASWLAQVTGKLSAAAKLTVLEMRLGPVPAGEEGGPSPRIVAGATLAAALGLFFFMLMLAAGGPKRSRRTRTLVAFFPLPLGVALSFLMLWPAYEFRPDFTVKRGMAAELPMPQGLQDDKTRLLAEKGRYLVGTAGCAVCHTVANPYRLLASEPLTGGARLRSAAFGRVYAGNLTGHDATGLGSWSKEHLRRAIRGGVGRDGRVFHWEAMPYNLSGAWSDEELEAVVTYLKAIPPVEHKVPSPESGDDLDGVGLSLFDHADD